MNFSLENEEQDEVTAFRLLLYYSWGTFLLISIPVASDGGQANGHRDEDDEDQASNNEAGSHERVNQIGWPSSQLANNPFDYRCFTVAFV